MDAFISLEYIPRSKIAGSYGNPMFNILRNCQTVFLSAMSEGSNFPMSLSILDIFFLYSFLSLKKKKVFFIITILVSVKWVLIVLIFISLIAKYVGYILMCSCTYWPFIYVLYTNVCVNPLPTF